MPPVVGVCSWSLQPSSPAELAERAAATGVDAVQLALDPLRTGRFGLATTVAALAAAGLTVRSGMVGTRGEDYATLESIARTGGLRPDEHWDENLSDAYKSAAVAAQLGLDLVSFHAGFLPEEPGAERLKLVERLRAYVDVFAARGVRVAFETGQETAATLLAVLDEVDRETVGVNFDPANMILYDRGDPIAALELLAPRVFQIHVKDARRTETPGTWGEEVVVGTGDVDWSAFFGVVRERGLDVDLMIEREAGDDRVADIRAAREVVERELGVPA